MLFIILRELLSDLGTLYQIILGLVAIGMMLKAPDGIWGLVFAKNKRAIIPITRRVPADLNEGD